MAKELTSRAENYAQWYNDLVIVSKDKAYIIDGYFCVSEITDFSIADAREDIMRGSMEYNKELPARKRESYER